MNVPSLIPFPKEYTALKGSVRIESIGIIDIPYEFENDVRLFITEAGLSKKTAGIRLIAKKTSNLPLEGYRMTVTADGISIETGDNAGLHHALETIRELMILGSGTIPCCIIDDAPAYGWRGFMLDCSRHFMPVSYIKKLIDAMSMLRMSVFHWHLTNDQGWRIEIKSPPPRTHGNRILA